MSNLLARLRNPAQQQSEARGKYPLDSLVEWFQYGGWSYPVQQTLADGQTVEPVGQGFEAYVTRGLQRNGIVWACMAVRASLFSEARLKFQRIREGRPGDFFGTTALEPLERPWRGETTRGLLLRIIQHADLAGNAFVVREQRRGPLRLLRPDWVTIAKPSPYSAEVAAYGYREGGSSGDGGWEWFDPDEVAHIMPKPDPIHPHRGMSWLTPVLREIEADQGATVHKKRFFDNGATPNMVVTLDKDVQAEAARAFREQFLEQHQGADQAYKTLFLGGGADIEVVGSDFKQLNFSQTQGHGETRIAAAAEVPPVIVGLSEGLQAATYSNYGQARRRFADGTLVPLWGLVAEQLGRLIDVPDDAQLAVDTRDIPFLSEDAKDAADIQQVRAQTIRSLIDAGYTPETVVDAVANDDMSLLEHSGLFSVQLQQPGADAPNGEEQ